MDYRTIPVGFGAADSAQQAPQQQRPGGGAPLIQILLNAIGSKVNEVIGDPRILATPNTDREIVNILIRRLARWLQSLWLRCIINSYARIDCPCSSIEALTGRNGYQIVDDFSYNIEIERLRAARQSSEAANGGATEDDVIPAEAPPNTPELPTPPAATSATSLDPLSGLGFGTTNSFVAAAAGQVIQEEGLTLSQQRLQEADRRTRELHAVKRRQAKLTRVVSVQDLHAALRNVNEFPMPPSLRAELLTLTLAGCPADFASIDNNVQMVQQILRLNYTAPALVPTYLGCIPAAMPAAPVEALHPPSRQRRFMIDDKRIPQDIGGSRRGSGSSVERGKMMRKPKKQRTDTPTSSSPDQWVPPSENTPSAAAFTQWGQHHHPQQQHMPPPSQQAPAPPIMRQR